MVGIVTVVDRLQGSLTGTSRTEVVLAGVIVVLAVVLLLARFLRSTDHRRRKGASAYFDKNAANKGAAVRDTSTGTALYPSSGPTTQQPMAPSFASPRKGSSPQDGSPTRGRPSSSVVPPRTPGVPGSGTGPDSRTPVGSPVLDPLPPLRTAGITMPPDGGRQPGPPTGATPDPPTPPTPTAPSGRTAVPANLTPLAPPPPTVDQSRPAHQAVTPDRATGNTGSDPDGTSADGSCPDDSSLSGSSPDDG